MLTHTSSKHPFNTFSTPTLVPQNQHTRCLQGPVFGDDVLVDTTIARAMDAREAQDALPALQREVQVRKMCYVCEVKALEGEGGEGA